MRHRGPPDDRQEVPSRGPQMIEVDVRVQNEGTIFVFHLQTPKAREWVGVNVQAEDYQWFGAHGGGLAVEHRYARDLAEGMKLAGLVVR